MFQFNWDKLGDKEAAYTNDALNNVFSGLSLPEFLGGITISDFQLGTVPPDVTVLGIEPISTKCKQAIIALDQYKITMDDFDDCKDIMVSVELDFKSDAGFNMDTNVVINKPTPRFIQLPVSFFVSDLHVRTTVLICIIGANKNVFLSFVPFEEDESPLCNIHIQADIGDPTEGVLTSVNKVKNIIVEEVRKLIKKRVTYPTFLRVAGGS